MIFKVWANNCVRPKGQRIIEASKKDLEEAVERVFTDAENSGLINILTEDDEIDNDKMDAAYSKIYEFYEKNKSLDAGDWMIIEAESIYDVEVPNGCPGDASIIF